MEAGTPKAPIRTAAATPAPIGYRLPAQEAVYVAGHETQVRAFGHFKNCTEAGNTGQAELSAGSVAKVQQRRIAAGRRGIDRERALVREPHQVIAVRRLSAQSPIDPCRRTAAPDHGADHIAVDVGIADRGVLKHLPPEGFQAGLHPKVNP